MSTHLTAKPGDPVVLSHLELNALIEAAIEHRAQAILVHHGYFWKGEPAPLTGPKGRRIRLLMQHGISLLAYHLPLDAHPQWGNNAQLGLRLPNSGPRHAHIGVGLLQLGRHIPRLQPRDQPACATPSFCSCTHTGAIRRSIESTSGGVSWCGGAASQATTISHVTRAGSM